MGHLGLYADFTFFVLLTHVVLLERYNVAMTTDCWQLSSPVGYSYQTMDQLLFSSLKWDSGRLGLRVDNLPIEVSHNNYRDKGNDQNCSRVMQALFTQYYLKCQSSTFCSWGWLSRGFLGLNFLCFADLSPVSLKQRWLGLWCLETVHCYSLIWEQWCCKAMNIVNKTKYLPLKRQWY